MPRTILLDPGVDLSVIEGTGLLVGGYLPSHVLGVYAAPTPPCDSEEECPKEPEIDVPWFMEHLTQVLRLLPGGLHVVGFLINSDQQIAAKSESKIRKLLAGVRTLDPCVEEPLLMYVKAKKASCLVGDNVTTVDVKVHDSPLDFVQLDTQLVLDCPVALNCDKGSDRMLLAHAERGIEKLERTIATSTCIFDNKLLKCEDLIAPSQLDVKPRKGKSKTLDDTLDSEDGEITKLKVTVLATDELNVDDEVKIEDNNVRLKLLGRMTSRCYVPAGTTVQACRDYLIQDVKRSIRGRLQMHCDSLVGEEVEPESLPVVHEPPRRVFTRLPGTNGISVSDYLYPGEGPEDSVESIKEVFGFTPCEEDIEDDLEIVAAAKDVKRDVEDKPKKSFMGSTRQVMLSVGVAALSAAFAYMRFRSADTENNEDN
eukprot:TRINITY_DN8438_c0_g1_i4.p1 TRINITY_DN8438_c0_g1~~TRINITY_DN8438_c0_g1_i4.p1  ORF type:complete len:426 (+),score=95.77 TRINITY_DN8438_c0_g1_i4:46-1323(+)